MDNDTMSLDEKVLALLSDARQEGYREGWQSAFRYIALAATNAIQNPQSVPERRTPPLVDQQAKQPPIIPRRRAPWGMSHRAIRAALKRANGGGVDVPTVRAIGFELESFDLADSSVRAGFLDLAERGEIEKRGDRWFRKETAGSASEATPAASATTHQGGSDARTTLTH
jgi:hypothetical protein